MFDGIMGEMLALDHLATWENNKVTSYKHFKCLTGA